MDIQVYWPDDLLSPRNVSFWVLASEVEPKTTHFVVNLIQCDDANPRSSLKDGINCEDVVVIGYLGSLCKHKMGLGLHFVVEDGYICCETATIIVYHPPLPNMMQFFSVTPIPISLTDSTQANVKYDLNQLLKNYDSRDLSKQEESLTRTIYNLNNCWIRRKQLLNKYPDMEKAWESKSSLRSLWSISRSFFIYFLEIYNIIMKPVNTLLLYIMVGIRHICLLIISLINARISSNFPSLVELSATAQQIDLRLQQFAYFPIQYIKTTKKLNLGNIRDRRLPIEEYPEYIRLLNTLWLIVNDILLGIFLGTTLIENQDLITEFFVKTVVSKILYSDLSSISVMLMNSPGDIKLNNELSSFLSDLFLWIIELWKIMLINPITPYSKHILYAIAIISTFGATFSIALFLDFLSVITFHVYIFYYTSSRIFNWCLNIMLSLFHLFLGQKRNVLRERIDSNDYEIDQLLLGTLLFTVVTFLMPTVLSFYVTFAFSQLSILIFLGTFEICTALLNHFPIFVILLRIKDYKRVPGSVEFVNKAGYLHILSKPIGINEMFAPFRNVFSKLKSSYLSSRTITGLIKGKPIHVQRNKFYKLLYSTLPPKHASTRELWAEIQKLEPSTSLF